MKPPIFGKGDTIYVPRLSPWSSVFGGDEIAYSHPSYEWCYSKYGFALPVDYYTVPFGVILDNGERWEADPSVVRIEPDNAHYVVVDKSGYVCYVAIDTDDGKITVTRTHIETGAKSWWLCKQSREPNHDDQSLLAFLYTDPTEDAVREYVYTYYKGTDLDPLSIRFIHSQIVPKAQKKFWSRLDDDARRATLSLINEIESGNFSQTIKSNLIDKIMVDISAYLRSQTSSDVILTYLSDFADALDHALGRYDQPYGS